MAKRPPREKLFEWRVIRIHTTPVHLTQTQHARDYMAPLLGIPSPAFTQTGEAHQCKTPPSAAAVWAGSWDTCELRGGLRTKASADLMLSRLFGFRIGRLEIPPTRPEIGLSLIERQGRLLALGHAHHRDKELKKLGRYHKGIAGQHEQQQKLVRALHAPPSSTELVAS
jgi:hypothetical protein